MQINFNQNCACKTVKNYKQNFNKYNTVNFKGLDSDICDFQSSKKIQQEALMRLKLTGYKFNGEYLTEENINTHDNYGKTALLVAKTPRETDLLLKAGADVTVKDAVDRTPLICARTFEQTQLIIHALKKVNADMKKALTEADDDGKTPLINAKTTEQTELLLKEMQEAGVDIKSAVNVSDYMNNTPLINAETSLQTEMLLNAGAEVNVKNDNGCTPLNLAKARLRRLKSSLCFIDDMESRDIKAQIKDTQKQIQLLENAGAMNFWE